MDIRKILLVLGIGLIMSRIMGILCFYTDYDIIADSISYSAIYGPEGANLLSVFFFYLFVFQGGILMLLFYIRQGNKPNERLKFSLCIVYGMCAFLPWFPVDIFEITHYIVTIACILGILIFILEIDLRNVRIFVISSLILLALSLIADIVGLIHVMGLFEKIFFYGCIACIWYRLYTLENRWKTIIPER